MDPLVDGKTGDLAQVVVGMGPDGTDPVGAKSDGLRLPAVDFYESFFTMHLNCLLIYTGEHLISCSIISAISFSTSDKYAA